MTLVSPSILSADILNLQEQLQRVESGGADMVHVDVMDGNFVPNITMGPLILQSINKVTDLPLDVHLMISNPENFIEEFRHSGAEIITIHAEASTHLDRTINQVRDTGAKVGVSLNPATPIEQIKWVLDQVDLVLVMSVNPGFSGQKFIQYTLNKIEELDRLRTNYNYSYSIQVDGGVKQNNASQIIESGADILVAGSAVFSTDEGIANSIQQLKNTPSTKKRV